MKIERVSNDVMADIELKFVNKTDKTADCYVSAHSHGCDEIVLYISGDGETEINGQKHAFKSGSVAYIGADKPHNERHFEESHLVYFGFSAVGQHTLCIADGVYEVKGFDRLLRIVEDIRREVQLQKKGYRRMCSALVAEFLVLFERNINYDTVKGPSLGFCANFFRENFSQTIDIRQFASDNGYDYDRFRKLFKTEFGMAPKQFIVECRLQKAYSMVAQTKESCTDISMLCGFSDSAQFSKMFRRRFGLSPEELRRARNKEVCPELFYNNNEVGVV